MSDWMNKWEHPVEKAPKEFRFKRVFFEICLIGLSSRWGFKILSLIHNVTYMWNLKHDTDELIYKTKRRFTDIGNKLMATKGEEVGEG